MPTPYVRAWREHCAEATLNSDALDDLEKTLTRAEYRLLVAHGRLMFKMGAHWEHSRSKMGKGRPPPLNRAKD